MHLPWVGAQKPPLIYGLTKPHLIPPPCLLNPCILLALSSCAWETLPAPELTFPNKAPLSGRPQGCRVAFLFSLLYILLFFFFIDGTTQQHKDPLYEPLLDFACLQGGD